MRPRFKSSQGFNLPYPKSILLFYLAIFPQEARKDSLLTKPGLGTPIECRSQSSSVLMRPVHVHRCMCVFAHMCGVCACGVCDREGSISCNPVSCKTPVLKH